MPEYVHCAPAPDSPSPAAQAGLGSKLLAAQIRSLQQQKAALTQLLAAIEQQVVTLKRMQRDSPAASE